MILGAYTIIEKSNDFIVFDNFLSEYEKGIFTPEKLDVLSRISDKNPNTLKNINFRIFEDDIFEMGEEFVSRIANYPNISYKLIKLAKNNPDLFQTVKQGFMKLEDECRKPEALDVEDKVASYLLRNARFISGNVEFEALMNAAFRSSLLDKPYSTIFTDEDFDKACDKAYEEEFFPHKKKDILFAKRFGMSELEAKKFYTAFGKNIDQIDAPDDIKEYIAELQSILKIENEMKSIPQIDYFYENSTIRVTPMQRIHMIDVLRKAYAKTFVEELNKTDEAIKSSDFEMVDVNGVKVKKYKLQGNFSFIVHSTDTGFKGAKKLVNNSYKETYEHPSESEKHLNSSCYITQDFMGHAPVGGIGFLAVYTTPKNEELNLCGPSDINSHIKSYNYAAEREMHFSASSLPENSRRVYSEVPVEIRIPDFILIYDDMDESLLENAYRAASEFGVPVIEGSKKEIEKQQIADLDRMMSEFEESGDVNLLGKIISRYETNVAGWLLNRRTTRKDDSLTAGIRHDEFADDFDKMGKSIYELASTFIDKAVQAGDMKSANQLRKDLNEEIEKYNCISLGNTPISETEMKFEAQSLIEKINQIVPEKVEEVADVLPENTAAIDPMQMVQKLLNSTNESYKKIQEMMGVLNNMEKKKEEITVGKQ